MTTVRDLATPHQAWSFIDCGHRWGEEKAAAASRPGASPAGWLPATVPGLAAQDLLSAGRIADPFYGDHVNGARWIEERDFIYKTVISISADEAALPARLVCESLDTFATVLLNGAVIARHENQMRRLSVDLGGKLKAGANVLAIVFEAGYPAMVRRAGERPAFWNEPWERMWVRKSQMSYGWDWAARTPTVGIADPIRIEFADRLWAGDLQVQGRPGSGGSGTIRAELPVSALAPVDGIAELVVDGAVLATTAVVLVQGASRTLELSTVIADARLWFPRELGAPHLYDVEVRVTTGGRILHRATARCGIRRIELVKDDPASPNGKVFYLRVNGVRLWAKGDNWLPIDFLHTRVTRDQYRAYLGLLQTGGVNCIRVWGGGIVEHAPFYELCDELGLIIWHDFPFACGIYPTAPEFLAEVRREAEDIVTRLRSHPSIAMWCGNNENEMLAAATNRPAAERFHPIYYEVLPEVCARLDPDRPYWPGSPATESRDLHPDSDQEGDRHNWDVWFHWKTTECITDLARFNSEFGAQSMPQRETVESFMHPDDVWSVGAVSRVQGQSPGLVMARHGAQFEKLFARAAAFGAPSGTDAMIATTQAFQADTIGRYIRHYRRNVAFTGGVVVWNYTSTWPSICWALVDWYRRPKQAYYECRRAFRAATVGIEPEDATQASFIAWASMDRPGRVRGTVMLELRDIASGAVVASASGAVDLTGPAAGAAARLALDPGLDRTRHALVARFIHDGLAEGETEERDFRYLVPIAQVKGCGGAVTAMRHGDRIEIAATGWRMRVGVEAFEAPAIWDDNYLDLMPGDRRTLRIAYGAFPEHTWLVADMGRRAALLPGVATTL